MRNLIFLIPQHFSWFKNYELLVFKLVPGAFLAIAKAISVFIDTDLLLMMKMVAKSNTRT